MSALIRRCCALVALAVVAFLFQPMPSTAQATTTCSVRWGSLAKSAGDLQSQTITNVRAGRHACFDRLVVDLRGSTPAGYHVSYVSAVHADGSGDVVPLRGGAKLQIIVKAPAYDGNGNATYRPANQRELRNVTGYSTFRQIAWAGSFEGQTTIGLGVRARLPFRVFVLDDGSTSRLVIDVAHRW